MKTPASTARDSDGIARCFRGAVISGSHTATHFLRAETVAHGIATSRHRAAQAFHRAETAFQHIATSFHRAEKSFLHAGKSSGGIALAQKQAENGRNRVFYRSKHKH